MIVIELKELRETKAAKDRNREETLTAWKMLQDSIEKYAYLTNCGVALVIDVTVKGDEIYSPIYQRFFNLDTAGERLLLCNRSIQQTLNEGDLKDTDDSFA